MTTIGFLHLIIEDFFVSKRLAGGCGLLKDYPQAAAFSRQVNNRQRRRYFKFGRVPMPFIRFLRDTGVHFTKPDEKLRGITAEELEKLLLESLPDRPQCIIRNGGFESLIKHLEYTFLIDRNNELKKNYRLVSKYKYIYKPPKHKRGTRMPPTY